jgi:hypothetical protein
LSLHKKCSPSERTEELFSATGIKRALSEKFSNGNPLPAAERRGFLTVLDVSLFLPSAITPFGTPLLKEHSFRSFPLLLISATNVC